MSTHIKTIKARYESTSKSTATLQPTYEVATLDITRFYGGKLHGAMLQITIQSDNIAYIQLTEQQVQELIQTLQDSFNPKIYPSE